MANDFVFTEDEITVDEALGYPKAYAKLCRDKSSGPFNYGPPFSYTPYALVQEEDARSKELDEMFPIVHPNAKPTTKPKIFVSLLWKQLNHLGNAGFDPEIIRVDPCGNVLYYHADASSPLAWDIDHWFPHTRGGLTVASNLRLLQWQVCKRKHNKLEFLIPWWDLQLGISISQFLSIFASSNSDFRHRAFSWLFSQGECEELNDSQTVDSHVFPQHFLESKDRLGLAPAALVRLRRESFDAPLRSLDVNRRPRSSTPIISSKKLKQISNENEDPLMLSYQAIAMARDSLKQREEAYKMQAEIHKLDKVNELQSKTEDEKLTIQELESVLLKKKKRVEKCRRLAESQSSYKAILEKMIRDAMHQSVVYKEQVRLNQAAADALLARLEAQKAICDSAERELHRRCKKRDELEKQVIRKPKWENSRKRSRIDDFHDEVVEEEEEDRPEIAPPCFEEENEPKMLEETNTSYGDFAADNLLSEDTNERNASCLHKQLKKFLEEEQRASSEERAREESTKSIRILKPGSDKINKSVVVEEKDYIVEERLQNLEIEDGGKIYNIKFPSHHESDEEADDGEESRRLRGKVNIEKWIQFLYQNSIEDDSYFGTETDQINTTDELIEKLNQIYPQKEREALKPQVSEEDDRIEEAVKPLNLEKMDGKSEERVEIKARNSITTKKGKENADMNIEAVKTKPTLFNKNPPYIIVPARTKDKEETVFTEKQQKRRVSVGDENVLKESNGKEKELKRSESARGFRRIPSSPSLLFEGVKKKVDCIRKKKLFGA